MYIMLPLSPGTHLVRASENPLKSKLNSIFLVYTRIPRFFIFEFGVSKSCLALEFAIQYC